MLAARHRFPSRGSMAVRTRAGARTEGPMLTPPPPEAPRGRISSLVRGQFAPGAKPIQNLVGTGVRELWTSMLDASTAIRLGDNSSRPRYFGTGWPDPQNWAAASTAEVNGDDAVRSGAVNAGNAPEFENKVASNGGPPRIAASLPVRGR
jgi:hypothetical protein